MTEEKQCKANPDELIETGLGLIARGLFRLGVTENLPAAAADSAFLVANIIKDIGHDFHRKVYQDVDS